MPDPGGKEEGSFPLSRSRPSAPRLSTLTRAPPAPRNPAGSLNALASSFVVPNDFDAVEEAGARARKAGARGAKPGPKNGSAALGVGASAAPAASPTAASGGKLSAGAIGFGFSGDGADGSDGVRLPELRKSPSLLRNSVVGVGRGESLGVAPSASSASLASSSASSRRVGPWPPQARDAGDAATSSDEEIVVDARMVGGSGPRAGRPAPPNGSDPRGAALRLRGRADRFTSDVLGDGAGAATNFSGAALPQHGGAPASAPVSVAASLSSTIAAAIHGSTSSLGSVGSGGGNGSSHSGAGLGGFGFGFGGGGGGGGSATAGNGGEMAVSAARRAFGPSGDDTGDGDDGGRGAAREGSADAAAGNGTAGGLAPWAGMRKGRALSGDGGEDRYAVVDAHDFLLQEGQMSAGVQTEHTELANILGLRDGALKVIGELTALLGKVRRSREGVRTRLGDYLVRTIHTFYDYFHERQSFLRRTQGDRLRQVTEAYRTQLGNLLTRERGDWVFAFKDKYDEDINSVSRVYEPSIQRAQELIAELESNARMTQERISLLSEHCSRLEEACEVREREMDSEETLFQPEIRATNKQRRRDKMRAKALAVAPPDAGGAASASATASAGIRPLSKPTGTSAGSDGGAPTHARSAPSRNGQVVPASAVSSEASATDHDEERRALKGEVALDILAVSNEVTSADYRLLSEAMSKRAKDNSAAAAAAAARDADDDDDDNDDDDDESRDAVAVAAARPILRPASRESDGGGGGGGGDWDGKAAGEGLAGALGEGTRTGKGGAVAQPGAALQAPRGRRVLTAEEIATMVLDEATIRSIFPRGGEDRKNDSLAVVSTAAEAREKRLRVDLSSLAPRLVFRHAELSAYGRLRDRLFVDETVESHRGTLESFANKLHRVMANLRLSYGNVMKRLDASVEDARRLVENQHHLKDEDKLLVAIKMSRLRAALSKLEGEAKVLSSLLSPGQSVALERFEREVARRNRGGRMFSKSGSSARSVTASRRSDPSFSRRSDVSHSGDSSYDSIVDYGRDTQPPPRRGKDAPMGFANRRGFQAVTAANPSAEKRGASQKTRGVVSPRRSESRRKAATGRGGDLGGVAELVVSKAPVEMSSTM